MAWLLVELFGDEGIEVTSCTSFDEIKSALAEFPDAIVVSDPWSRRRRAELSADERSDIADVAARARLILTTTQQWGQRSDMHLDERVTVIPKPFDLDELLRAVRQPAASLKKSA